MSAIPVKKTGIGRPSMDEEAKARIYSVLSELQPKTPEYREARRQLACDLGYVELTIDLQFKRMKAQIEKENGRGSDKLTARASSTSEDASS